ncbi:IS1634 family transposase ISSeq4 [Sporomusa acidovorans DSM 3132]|uniref:IS1634 family transposase ISSeq4 n=1 Tax=Sporomusa acidovorans (strain ATCC 49682 / DSM 3132 / Mol) TaxID=1123286 RepID=A0ABZ3IZE6_SPOA4
MFLRKATNKKTGRTYLSIVHGYYDPSTRSSRTKTIQSIGYLDELEKQYNDPIAHFTAVANELDAQRLDANASYSFSINKQELLSIDTDNSKNFGYVAASSIYHELGVHSFLKNRQRHTNDAFDANVIMQMLVYSRLLFPASKKNSFDHRHRFFEKTDYSLDDVYRSLTFLCKHKDALQLWLNDKVKEHYGRDTSLIYYDVTNYYFETDKVTDFKRKGVSKEHRPNPIVQMGLFMDNNGIPITYELFPGNTNDCLTYRPNFGRLKKDYNLGRVITVADKGMTTGDNIWYTINTPTKDGYVFSMSVRGAEQEVKDYVLDQNGYEWLGKEYKRKSRLYPRTILVSSRNGRKMKKTVDEKQVVFYSEKYDKRAKAERAAVLAKAQALIRNPGNYTRATSYGAAAYVKNIAFDKETGEVLSPAKGLQIDEEKIKAEEALDGYYILITSEYQECDDRIIDMYRGLWRIEESFRVTKSDLEARPVYVSRKDHIQAHFLTCFVALVIARILELKTEHRYSIGKLLESLSQANCTHVKENLYLFSYYDEVLELIGEKTAIPFNRKMMSLGEIKKVLGDTKK